MKYLLGNLFAVLSAGLLTGPVTAQVIDPGWDDPIFSHYTGDPSAHRPNPRDDLGAATGESVAFSLPVFTLVGSGEVDPGLGAGDSTMSERVDAWPDCASEFPLISTIPQLAEQSAGLELGTWYSRHFDYECIEIALEGDQNFEPAAPARVPGLERSGDIVVVYHGGDTESSPASVGIPTVGYRAGSLVYSITVYCSTDQSLSFCANQTALRSLPRALIVVAGIPDG